MTNTGEVYLLAGEKERSLRLGDFVGRGSFSEVFHVEVRPNCADTDDSSLASNHCLVYEPVALIPFDARLVIKRLMDKTLVDKEIEYQALTDLLREVEILTSLPRHENIVALYGVSSESPDQKDTFLLLEKCDTTLDKCLECSRNSTGTHLGGSIFRLNRRRQTLADTQRDRVQDYAVGIARALHFLHKHDVAHRDLKPSNIGVTFSVATNQCVVKLFDFGLARTCREWHCGIAGKYAAGTARYMSPEQMLRKEHGKAVDAHSFGIVLWHICALQNPFANGVTSDFLKNMIAVDQRRPPLHRIQSPLIAYVLTKCWAVDPAVRPRFHETVLILQKYIDNTNS